MPYFEPHETPETIARAQRRLRQHTLAVLNRDRFVRNYPEQASIAREFVQTLPGIRGYRFDRAHVSGEKGCEGPLEFALPLESSRRHRSITLLPDDSGRWIPIVGADGELKRAERKPARPWS